MKTEQIIILIVSFFLGMLLLNMIKNVCGCELKEGFQENRFTDAECADTAAPGDCEAVAYCNRKAINSTKWTGDPGVCGGDGDVAIPIGGEAPATNMCGEALHNGNCTLSNDKKLDEALATIFHYKPLCPKPQSLCASDDWDSIKKKCSKGMTFEEWKTLAADSFTNINDCQTAGERYTATGAKWLEDMGSDGLQFCNYDLPDTLAKWTQSGASNSVTTADLIESTKRAQECIDNRTRATDSCVECAEGAEGKECTGRVQEGETVGVYACACPVGWGGENCRTQCVGQWDKGLSTCPTPIQVCPAGGPPTVAPNWTHAPGCAPTAAPAPAPAPAPCPCTPPAQCSDYWGADGACANHYGGDEDACNGTTDCAGKCCYVDGEAGAVCDNPLEDDGGKNRCAEGLVCGGDQSGGWSCQSAPAPAPSCTLPKRGSLAGYVLPGEGMACSVLTAGSIVCDDTRMPTCADGYILAPEGVAASCPAGGAPLTLSGCGDAPSCTIPITAETGYVIGDMSCDNMQSGSINCNTLHTCAEGYTGEPTLSDVTCLENGAPLTLSGCDASEVGAGGGGGKCLAKGKDGSDLTTEGGEEAQCVIRTYSPAAQGYGMSDDAPLYSSDHYDPYFNKDNTPSMSMDDMAADPDAQMPDVVEGVWDVTYITNPDQCGNILNSAAKDPDNLQERNGKTWCAPEINECLEELTTGTEDCSDGSRDDAGWCPHMQILATPERRAFIDFEKFFTGRSGESLTAPLVESCEWQPGGR